MPNIYVEEFLFRGRDPRTGAPPAWHVSIGELPPDGWDGPPKSTGPMAPTRAEALHGVTLATIVDEIAAAAVLRASELEDEVSSLRAQLEAAREEVSSLNQRLKALKAGVGDEPESA